MVWTHFFDLLFKLISIIPTLFIIITVMFPIFADEGSVILLVVFMLGFWYVIYKYLFRTLATYLYCRISLKMKVSFEEARQLNEAYTPIFGMKWLPMKELRNARNIDKYQVALGIFRAWDEERRQDRQQAWAEFNHSGLGTRALTVLKYLLIVYFCIAVINGWPPADFLISVYCRLFDTERYYPALIMIILILPVVWIFKAIDKNIK
jgi:hypothetical protein